MNEPTPLRPNYHCLEQALPSVHSQAEAGTRITPDTEKRTRNLKRQQEPLKASKQTNMNIWYKSPPAYGNID